MSAKSSHFPLARSIQTGRTVGGTRWAQDPAFTLVEVMLALGIFSFCIVSVIFLLGIGLTSSRDSQKDSAMAAALHSIDSSMRAIPPSTLDAAPMGPQASGIWFTLDLYGNVTSSGTTGAPSVSSSAVTSGSYSFLATLTRMDPSSPIVSQTMGFVDPSSQNSDPNIHEYWFLWTIDVAYPPPNYPNHMKRPLLFGNASYDDDEYPWKQY